jgi:hypothetical protein
MGVRGIFPVERVAVKLDCLRKGAFDGAKIPELVERKSDHAEVCACDGVRIAGFASGGSFVKAFLKRVRCWRSALREAPALFLRVAADGRRLGSCETLKGKNEQERAETMKQKGWPNKTNGKVVAKSKRHEQRSPLKF